MCKNIGIFPLYLSHKDHKGLMLASQRESGLSTLKISLDYKQFLVFLKHLSCHCNQVKNNRTSGFLDAEKEYKPSCGCNNNFNFDSASKYLELHK